MFMQMDSKKSLWTPWTVWTPRQDAGLGRKNLDEIAFFARDRSQIYMDDQFCDFGFLQAEAKS
jgi:hypothetical protein